MAIFGGYPYRQQFSQAMFLIPCLILTSVAFCTLNRQSIPQSHSPIIWADMDFGKMGCFGHKLHLWITPQFNI